MNVLECCLLLQIAMLIGPAAAPTARVPAATVPVATAPTATAPAPSAIDVLLTAAQPVAEHLVSGVPYDALSALPDFPTKIWVQAGLRDSVARLWLSSPTFRRQGMQIQAWGAVQVQIRLDPSLVDNSQHLAMCELRHYAGGAIIARVAVSPVRLAEMIGHEMEHVCERLEGIRVEDQSRKHLPGYYALGTHNLRYETDRAIRVGRQVQAEANLATVLTLRTH
jgi:hypothetical protein